MSRSTTRSAGFRTVVFTCLAVTVLDGVDLLMPGIVGGILLACRLTSILSSTHPRTRRVG